MIYIVIGLVITVLVIVISSVKASDKQTPEPDAESDEDSEYSIVDLYTVDIYLKNGEYKTLRNVYTSQNQNGFKTFVGNDDSVFNVQIDLIKSYSATKTGTEKRQLYPRIIKDNAGAHIQYY